MKPGLEERKWLRNSRLESGIAEHSTYCMVSVDHYNTE